MNEVKNMSDSTAASEPNKRLISKLKTQRVYQNTNALGTLAESLMNRVEDDSEVKINEDELDKINKDIIELQERLIKVAQA